MVGAELQEVLQEGDGSEATPETPQAPPVPSVLWDRLALYREAAGNARHCGDAARLRRLQRGLRVSPEPRAPNPPGIPSQGLQTLGTHSGSSRLSPALSSFIPFFP
ncbi:coiled-coil and C2 domain-containing protein 1A-like, partial [Manacus candei]|uniref:coiled-coil and C2 domain-containing protein 1A-like n=1 Tax=Manacus candei TaxID=415023 RepID=UPI002225EC41